MKLEYVPTYHADRSVRQVSEKLKALFVSLRDLVRIGESLTLTVATTIV